MLQLYKPYTVHDICKLYVISPIFPLLFFPERVRSASPTMRTRRQNVLREIGCSQRSTRDSQKPVAVAVKVNLQNLVD